MLMKKWVSFFFYGIVFLLFFVNKIYAQSAPTPTPIINLTPMVEIRGCPADDPFAQGDEAKVPCKAPSNPNDATTGDVWVRDDEVTALWKGGERARQFLYWVLTHRSIDNHPSILYIWSVSRNIVYFLLVLVGILMALSIIITQRSNLNSNFDLKTKAFPWFMKLIILLIYVTFSATLVIFIIQISDIIMQFFLRSLGGDKIFNIFGYTANSEDSYRNVVHYRNINRNNWEMVRTSMFLIRFTNMTYYVMGIMLILRKVILWFLIILSPFLALLIPYVFIRNIGWIWIGVFFQWVFYGPLFGLFLGTLAKIWNSAQHIPYIFDFSRRWKASEIVYPTSISILYGGPAQTLSVLNSANYVDTFAEYIISLIMLWTAIFFPWWLLRIFRDYCCEGIYAMKNILLGIYESLKSGAMPPAMPAPTPATSSFKTAVSSSYQEDKKVKMTIRLDTLEEIKKAKTEDIHQSMNIKINRLTDVANFETNKKLFETVVKNLSYLQNPLKAQTPTERQKYMNIRSELYDRAIKGDWLAKQTLSALVVDKNFIIKNENLMKNIPQTQSSVKILSEKLGIPEEKTTSLVTAIFKTISQNTTLVNSISNQTNLSQTQVQSILNALTQQQNINQPTQTFITNLSQKTGISTEKIKEVIEKTKLNVQETKELSRQIAEKNQMKDQIVDKVIDSHVSMITEPEKHIEETITVPPTVPIEEYEEVKKMWINQYEKGEVPISENIKDRKEWVKTDIITITNILNKILSSDEKLKAEGLEQLGYILPLLLINNLRGDQLVVYLKAKLEAAKQVNWQLEKEEEIRKKVEEKEREDEVFVEVPKKEKKDKEKTLQIEEEIKNEEKKPLI